MTPSKSPEGDALFERLSNTLALISPCDYVDNENYAGGVLMLGMHLALHDPEWARIVTTFYEARFPGLTNHKRAAEQIVRVTRLPSGFNRE